MNPWDIHAALLAKHVQHVVLIHFPIALFLTGVGLDAAAAWWRRQELAVSAYVSLTVAAVTALPAAATGLAAWQWELEGRRLKGILLLHAIGGGMSFLLILVTWWIHRRSRRRNEPELPAYRWPFEVLGVIAITLTGHLGGFLSGVNHP